MIRKLVHADAEVLRTKASKVRLDAVPCLCNNHMLALDLLETMFFHRALGLAAPQIGIADALFVINPLTEGLVTGLPEGQRPFVFVNPVLVRTEGDLVESVEGCLSLPDQLAFVSRAEHCLLQYDDLEGHQHEAEFRGLVARVVQHELDHLEGKLIQPPYFTRAELLQECGKRYGQGRSKS